MAALFQPPRSAVELDGHGGMASGGEVPLPGQRPLGLKAPLKTFRGEGPNVTDVVKAHSTARLGRSPVGLAYPPHVVRCHLCSVYQVSGFAAILHKWVRGALPPPNVKGRYA